MRHKQRVKLGDVREANSDVLLVVHVNLLFTVTATKKPSRRKTL
jgi:hypothetical protein